MWKRAGWLSASLALISLLLAGQLALADQPKVEIAFLVDDSASITAANFITELQGLASALSDPQIMPSDGSVAVAVLQFSSTVRTVVPLQAITPLSMLNIPSKIISSPQEGQNTDLASGLRAATTTLQGGFSGAPGAWRIIFVITDGMPDDPVAALAAAADAMNAGISEIDALGVGSLVDANFLAALISPRPPATFAIVDGYQALAQAIAAKTHGFVSVGHQPSEPSGRELLSLEGLLHGQEGLIRSYADLLQTQWQALSPDERIARTASLEKLLHSQQDLLERFAALIDASVCPQPGTDPQLVFVKSFEVLLHSQADLLMRFEQTLMAFGKPSAEFVASLESLIHGQGGLISHFEGILHCLSQLPAGVPPDMWNGMLASFEDLIHSQEDLIRGFSALL
jgi:uncharacterized protein YegL